MSFWKSILGALKAYFLKKPDPPVPPAPPDPVDDASALVSLMNAERKKLGLVPFIRDRRLDSSALNHSSLMATYGKMSHQLPGEPPFEARILSKGYHWFTAAENIATGQRTAEEVLYSWLNEIPPYDGHRKAIVGDNVNVGCGMAYNPTTSLMYYWTADFGTEYKNSP